MLAPLFDQPAPEKSYHLIDYTMVSRFGSDINLSRKFPAHLGRNPGPGLCPRVNTNFFSHGKFSLLRNLGPGLAPGFIQLNGTRVFIMELPPWTIEQCSQSPKKKNAL